MKRQANCVIGFRVSRRAKLRFGLSRRACGVVLGVVPDTLTELIFSGLKLRHRGLRLHGSFFSFIILGILLILLSFFRKLLNNRVRCHSLLRRFSPRNEIDSFHSWFVESVAKPAFFFFFALSTLTLKSQGCSIRNDILIQ